MKLFDSLINSVWFRQNPVILLLNKRDFLRKNYRTRRYLLISLIFTVPVWLLPQTTLPVVSKISTERRIDEFTCTIQTPLIRIY